MSTIEFKDLNNSIGTELFTDTESFLEDLGEDAANVVGGLGNVATAFVTTTHYKGPVTTVYIPTDHPPIRPTIVLHNPVYPRHPRPVHPVRYPRPIHHVFTGNDA
jgi:hypothetical protein